jgi:hypothetical protein
MTQLRALCLALGATVPAAARPSARRGAAARRSVARAARDGGGGSGGGGGGGGGGEGGAPHGWRAAPLLVAASALLSSRRATAAEAPTGARDANESLPQVSAAAGSAVRPVPRAGNCRAPAHAAGHALTRPTPGAAHLQATVVADALAKCLYAVASMMPIFALALFGWVLTQSSLSVSLGMALKQADALVTGVLAAAGWALSSYLGRVDKRFDDAAALSNKRFDDAAALSNKRAALANKRFHETNKRFDDVNKQLKELTDLLLQRSRSSRS